MAYRLNGCDTGGLPIHIIKAILNEHNVPYLVETGTANGDSARLGATIFKKVWTIEIVEGRQNATEEENIDFLVGDSSELLPSIIADLNYLRSIRDASEGVHQWVIFYLDAHYSDIVPNESPKTECPLLSEINAISQYGEDAIIIIDDARLFFGHPPYPHNPQDWPSVCEIFVLLRERFPYHHITITDDYILSIPIHIRQATDKEWRDRFHIRYPSDEDKLRGQVKDVWNAFNEKIYKSFLEYVK